jgi:hypothetical protein
MSGPERQRRRRNRLRLEREVERSPHGGVLLIVCPVTGKEFSTGVQVDAESVPRLLDVESTAYCPYCKTDHTWRPRQARYVDAIPPEAWPENQE